MSGRNGARGQSVEDPKCEALRAERAQRRDEMGRVPSRLPSSGQGAGSPNPEMARILDRIRAIREEMRELGCT
ncbi:MAG: hypothetical protein V3V06_06660, partial [Dehalococcoidia bacterium]